MLTEPATSALEPYHIQLLFVMSSDFKDKAICHQEKKPWPSAQLYYTQVAVKEQKKKGSLSQFHMDSRCKDKPTPAQDMIICAGGGNTASR